MRSPLRTSVWQPSRQWADILKECSKAIVWDLSRGHWHMQFRYTVDIISRMRSCFKISAKFTIHSEKTRRAQRGTTTCTFHYCMVPQNYVLYRRLVNLDCKSSECVFGSENTETSSGRRVWLKYWTDGLTRLRKYKVQRALKPSLEAQPRKTAFHQIPQMAWTSDIVAIIYFSFDICGPWIIFGT